MKKMQCFLLAAILLFVFAAEASAVRMESNGNSWFLPDGRIVQTKRIVTENGAEYPGLLCYNEKGELLWEHNFRTNAVGRSYCRLTDENMIAFMYHDQNRQYFVEYFDSNGNFVQKSTRERYTTDSILYAGGAVFCEEMPQYSGTVLSLRHWDGSEKRWELQGAEKISLYSAESHGNGVCIEVNMRNSHQSAHSILYVDAAEDLVLWAYRLDTELPVKAYTGNEQGGITLFVQREDANGQFKLQMITLDRSGTETFSTEVEGIPAVMAINILSEQENGLYSLYGYGYDIYGENKIICAKLNEQGEVVERKDIPTDYATCVRYMNNEIYALVYENGIENYELVPLDELAE